MVPEEKGRNEIQSTLRGMGLHGSRKPLPCNRAEHGEDKCKKVTRQSHSLCSELGGKFGKVHV